MTLDASTPDAPTVERPASLRRTTARGFIYTGGQQLLVRLLSLVSFVVLARLLTPEDYGLAALANVFVVLLQHFAALGFSQALVQKREVDRLDLDSIFWFGMAAGVALAVLLFVGAWPLASLFGEPELRAVLQVLSCTPIFVALGSTHQAVLQRRFAFRSIAAPAVIANLVATIVGVTFAFAGFGVWSLVVQTVLGVGLNSIGLVAVSGYRPSRSFSMQRFRSLFAVSNHYFGTGLLSFLNGRTDDFLIGAVLGPVALGIYTVAYRLLEVMLDVLQNSVRSVAFPVFSRIQDDRERLVRAYLSATRMSAAIATPIFCFTAAAAPEITAVVFGDKWAASAPVMRILCLYGALGVVTQFNMSALQSMGYSRTVLRITAAGTVLQVIGFAAAVPFGVEWVAASFVIRAYLIAPVGLVIASRALRSSLRQYGAALVGSTISTVAMVTAVLLVDEFASPADPVAHLAVLILVGAATYVTVLRVIAAQDYAEALGYVRAAITRHGRSSAAA